MEVDCCSNAASADCHPTPSCSPGPLITVKVAHGLRQHEITIPADSTIGDLKRALQPATCVCPHEQRLLFKGFPREDHEYLCGVGIKNKSRIILIEDPASKERRMEGSKKNDRVSRACEAVANVRLEVDHLASQVASLEDTVVSGKNVPHQDFAMLSELLMRQLLKLDEIDAEGEARVQRKSEVQRVQAYADLVDKLKTRNNESANSAPPSCDRNRGHY